LISQEGPPTTLKLFGESQIAVRQSSGTEMTQPVLNCEACAELRNTGFDETAISTGATL